MRCAEEPVARVHAAHHVVRGGAGDRDAACAARAREAAHDLRGGVLAGVVEREGAERVLPREAREVDGLEGGPCGFVFV